MRKTSLRRALALGALATGLSAVPLVNYAADHIDGPAAMAEPTADIADFFAWTNADATKINLVTTVFPFAGQDAAFSDAVQYVFHVNSSMGYGMDQTETQVLCQFYSAEMIECWAGDDYVTGDPSDPAGITSDSGKLRVFAGLRNDPFFFEFNGFTNAVTTVVGAAGGLTFDAAGCPALDMDTSNALIGQLQSGTVDENTAGDTFAGQNVLALVVQVDKTLVNSGGPVLGIWTSTHMGN